MVDNNYSNTTTVTRRLGSVKATNIPIAFLLAHIPLALIMDVAPQVATLHALITFGVGVWMAIFSRKPSNVAITAAYIMGCEVLWRMTNAVVFWEFGKYAVVFLLGIGLIRIRKWKSIGFPVVFFALLLVSIPLTLTGTSLSSARDQISFNLSGPLSLAISVIFFAQISLTWEDRERLIWVVAAPLVGIASLCLKSILGSENIMFSNNSNFATSGGFGPNQVSAVLGVGSLLLILLAIRERRPRVRWTALLTACGLLVFSVLTFSRGGLYNLAAALLASSLFLLKNKRLRQNFFVVLFVAIIAGSYFVFPVINNFTGGMFAKRFSDTNTTGRVEIMEAELKVWENNPWFGVGPGMASFISASYLGARIGAHTEYTRILAEHGIPGIISMSLMFVMALRAVKKSPAGMGQAWAAALVVWSLVEMTHAAMRIAAIGFLFGLTFASWKTQGSSPQVLSNENPAPR